MPSITWVVQFGLIYTLSDFYPLRLLPTKEKSLRHNFVPLKMTFPIIAKLVRDADKFCNYFVFFVETVCNEKSGVTMKLTCVPFNKMKKDVEQFEG